MAGPFPSREPRQAPEDVARDLAEIEARLKSAQAELEAVTNERREALDRLGRLHADRLGDHEGEDEGRAAGQPPPPDSP
jgi:outer membrane protein TolC